MKPVEQLKETKKTDCPSYYTRFAIQPVEFIMKNKLGFCEGSIIKYVCRYPYKGGIEDLKKAKRFIEFLIEKENKDE